MLCSIFLSWISSKEWVIHSDMSGGTWPRASQVFPGYPDICFMTNFHEMSTHTSVEAEPSGSSRFIRPKPPLWLWVILAIGLMEVAGVVLGLGAYFVFVDLPETSFSQIYEEPWQQSNVNRMIFEKPEDFLRARNTLLEITHQPQTKKDVIPHYLLAELYNTTNQTADAIRSYQKVVRFGEESWYNRLAYRNFIAKAHAALALLYYEQGRNQSVLKELNAIPNLDETEKPSLLQALRDSIEYPERADFHMLLGKELRHDLKLALAARELKNAERLSHNPQLRLDAVNFMKTQMPQQSKDLTPMARYFSLAGEAQQYQYENLERAATFYQLATAEMPDYEWGYNELAVIYRQKKDFARAANYAKRAISLNPNFYNPYLTLGDIALDQEHYAEAIRYFQTGQAIIQRLPSEESMPLVANIENQIGYAYESLDQPDEAARHYEKAMLAATDGDEESTEDFDYAQEGLSRVVESRQKADRHMNAKELSWQPSAH